AYLQAQLSEPFFIKGGYGIDIQGKNTSRGQSILLELAWDFNATQREFTKTRRIEKSKSDLEKFDIESTEYNESLFREESPQPMRRKKKKSVKQMLDEAEEMLDK
ncbi:MAG: hypothetical protein KDD35_08285, partial [Bdellovibrionales bacterium]|nr:hypothetical protein [Bdellovibrionales bacterium]